jgi:hypothetical protein
MRLTWMWPVTWPNRSNTPSHVSSHHVSVSSCHFSLRALKAVTLHEAMVGRRMVLSEAVSSVELAWSPVHVEVSLCNAIFEPVPPHVKRL